MTKHLLTATLLGAFALGATPADAQAINYTITGAASGTITLNLEPTSAYTLESLDLVAPNATWTTSNTLFFDLVTDRVTPPNVADRYCFDSSETCGISSTGLGLELFIFPDLTSQTATLYWSANGVVDSGLITVSQVRPAVPEPATWAMMLVGFGAVCFAMRRRRAAQVPVLLA